MVSVVRVKGSGGRGVVSMSRTLKIMWSVTVDEERYPLCDIIFI